MSADAQAVLAFWFDELGPKQWWGKDDAVDAAIAERFGALHGRVAAGEGWSWRSDAQGRLAEVLVLDQFSRHLYRDDARAYAFDGMALALAQEIVQRGLDHELDTLARPFAYMPYMHSESLAIHAVAESLFDQPGLENALDFERRHVAILRQFGRYPHRNAALGRESSAIEQAFLEQPGSRF